MFTLNDGYEIPKILFGTYLISDQTKIEECVDVALSAGYRGFDSATVYKNEKFLGDALRKGFIKYHLSRNDVYVTSKLAPSDQGYEKACEAVDRSVSNLGLEYVDLYLIHWPGTSKMAKEAPEQMENRRGSWRALEEARKKGSVRSIGVSNYTVRHLEEMDKYATVMPAVNQVECHPFLTQQTLTEYCRSRGVLFQAYSSLGTTANRESLLGHEIVKQIAQKAGKTESQVLLKWALQRGISVLPKSTNPEHIRANFLVSDWELTADQMKALFLLNKEHHFCWDPQTVA